MVARTGFRRIGMCLATFGMLSIAGVAGAAPKEAGAAPKEKEAAAPRLDSASRIRGGGGSGCRVAGDSGEHNSQDFNRGSHRASFFLVG